MRQLSVDLEIDRPADGSATWRPTVGDAVRIVLLNTHPCPEAPHFACEAGRTGRVICSRPVAGAPSHPHLVKLDRTDLTTRLSRLDDTIAARHYAADELELIA